MSAICQNFVQNAWKKELCSNCFKSRDEHVTLNKLKPLPPTDKTVDGIIKSNKAKPKRSVCFTNQLSEVIGYGGEDWTSDIDDNSSIDDSPEKDFETEEEEEEGEFCKLTKANTDFNTNSLADVGEVKKSYTQLMLGKPQVDADGRKQTLLVSVTPFGQENSRKYGKQLSHIPIARNNKEVIAETKSPNIVLKSYTKSVLQTTASEEKSLLDEITETLENGTNPIQIIARKKKEDEATDSKGENDKENLNKENVSIMKDQDLKVNKTNSPERKNGLNRNPVILKRDQEKPVISTAKIELMNTRNSKFITKTDNSKIYNSNINNSSDEIAKPEIKEEASVFKEIGSITTKDGKNDDSNDKLEETSSTESEISEKSKIVMSNDNPVSPKFNGTIYPQSREQAGEPDGRADPDTLTEPPALPLTPPPPLEMQSSFLHGSSPQSYEKPKVPSKPMTTFIRKSLEDTQTPPLSQLTIMEVKAPVELLEKTKLTQQDSNSSECSRIVNNKRRAPKPPEETNLLYARNLSTPMNIDCPVVREKEKRDRASSCSPKLQNEEDEHQEESNYASIPEPVPRKSLFMSTDNLVEEKQKEKTKGRFSLKKFLRISNSSKHVPKLQHEITKNDDVHDGAPHVKPRLVIVHPLDLSGTKVEVVSKSLLSNGDYSVPNNLCSAQCTEQLCSNNISRAAKPPPPPRNLEDHNRNSKPNLPTPPKSAEILFKQRHFTRVSNARKVDTVYANIGEVRSAITPNKPQRTASMREREAQQEKEKQKRTAENYEHINISNRDYNENVYDYINNGRSSSPEYDSSPDKSSPNIKIVRPNALQNKRSESNIDVSGETLKFNNIPRSLSLTYCGSETESEIYSPYSFYGSESEVGFTIRLCSLPTLVANFHGYLMRQSFFYVKCLHH